jgi:hypothetical protein
MNFREKHRSGGVQPITAPRDTWFERFKEAVCDVIFFPNPPRVHIEP